MKYEEVTQLNLPDIDREILQFWEDNDIFEKSVNQRPKDQLYVFYL
jgi:isoleucyl-tRNA synthetase